MTRSTHAAAALLAGALLGAPGTAGAAARFAVVVGNDVGGASRPRLWFAERDAERFRRTLLELGDFDDDRVVLLRGAEAGRLREALAAVEARIQAAREAGEHPLLLLYFSGHAGSGGLELGQTTVPFAELRQRIAASGAEARVAIVDACESGQLTQVKGASVAPALDFAVPSDDPVRGSAFVASTALGESAQESAALGGSFFTHHLEIALRGAGDADGDGLVTLGEAFRYTSARTRAGTVGTALGPQHPTYDFRMSGRGDVVLSDLRRADARIAIPADPGASYVLRGPMSLLAEVEGGTVPVTLAVPAGDYRIERRSPGGRATAELTLSSGATRLLPPLLPTRYELARAKGGPKPGLLFAGFGATSVGPPGFGFASTLRLGARKEVGPLGVRVRLDYGAGAANDSGLRFDLAYAGGAVAVLYPLNTGRVLLEAGPELGGGYAWQRLQDRRSFGSAVAWAGVAAMATAPVGPLRLGLDAGVGAQTFRVNFRRQASPGFHASLLALWGF
jgi:hypothetical protein